MFRVTAFVLAALGLGLGSAARADDAEDKAVALVEKLGGKITRDDKAPGKPVTTVEFDPFRSEQQRAVTNATWKELAALKSLTALRLYNCLRVTDAGVKELTALNNLTQLNLMGTQVTDEGLKEVVPLKSLTTLLVGGTKALGGTKVTDAGVKALAALKSLTTLYLSDTKVTDAGVKELQKALPKCKIIK